MHNGALLSFCLQIQYFNLTATQRRLSCFFAEMSVWRIAHLSVFLSCMRSFRAFDSAARSQILLASFSCYSLGNRFTAHGKASSVKCCVNFRPNSIDDVLSVARFSTFIDSSLARSPNSPHLARIRAGSSDDKERTQQCRSRLATATAGRVAERVNQPHRSPHSPNYVLFRHSIQRTCDRIRM